MKLLLRSALLLLATGGLALPAGASAADSIYGVTAKKLVRFSSADPSTPERVVTIALGDESMVAIDVRPRDGRIFGLTNLNHFISINPDTGAYTNIGFPSPQAGAMHVDFNPVVDRLRVVSDANKNYRLNPDGAAVTQDSDLTPAGAMAGIAYDRNFAGTPLTTLFGIDSGTDSLVRIGGEDGTPSPNGGTVTTLGALGVNTGATVGFDISPNDGQAYASLPVAGVTGLFTVDLNTGAATRVGDVPTTAGPIVDIAVAQPELSVAIAGSLGDTNALVRASGTNPATGFGGSGFAFVNGLQSGERIIGLDARPSTGELIAVSSASRLYSVDPATGSAAPIGTGFGPALSAGGTGADIDPATDSLRVVDEYEKNYRINPLTGLTTAVDGTLAPAGEITAAAYSPGPNPVLFDLDSATNALYRQDPPNTGTITPVGAGGLAVNNVSGTPALDLQVRNGFDIPQSGGAAFLVTRDGAGGNTNLYRVLTGTVISGQRVHLVATNVFPSVEAEGLAVLLPGTLATGPATAVEGDGTATVIVTRSGGTSGRATVEYATADGTAKAGEDYTPVRGVLRFAEGQSVRTISVPVADDTGVEPAETFGLTLTRPGEGALLGTTTTATVKLLSDDAAPAATATPTPDGTATPGPGGTPTPEPSPTATPTPPDTTKPLAFVAILPGQTLRGIARRGLRLQVVSGEAATAKLASKVGKVKLPAAKATFTAGGVKTLKVKLTKKLKKRFAKAKKAGRLTVKVVLTDTAGNASSANAAAVLPRR